MYSRDTAERDIAARLQNELQRFTAPWYRPRTRTLRVFRDQTNLQASPDLWGTINDAMSSSQWLLLVASPRSAESAGVRRELTWWREQRGTANICIALTDGELRWDQAANDFEWPASTALSQEALGHAFDITSGQEIGSITLPAGLRNVSTSVAFTPNGKDLISATEGTGGSSGPGYVTEWSFSSRLWSTVACTSAGHTLTSAEWQEYVGTGGPGMPSQLAC